MGVNNSKRLAAKCSFLSKDEQVIVSQSFRLVSKNSEKIKEDDLVTSLSRKPSQNSKIGIGMSLYLSVFDNIMLSNGDATVIVLEPETNKLWGPQMDSRLMQYITNYLFGRATNRQQTVEFEKFAEMYVFCIRGTVDERLQVLLKCLGKNDIADPFDVTYILVKEFVESIVSTFMKIQKISNTKQYQSWISRGSFSSPQNVQKFAESLTHELAINTQTITESDLSKWIGSCTILGILLQHVFNHLYHITHKEKEKDKDKSQGTAYYSPDETHEISICDREKNLIPFCRGLDLIPSYPSLLDLNQLVFINANLPAKYRYEWRFLFSSEIHGESFSTLIGRIINQGPSVLIIEDKNGYMFGGFAPVSWNLSPKWVGDDSSFLFTLTPKMRIFPSTGYNDHYQYLNLNQQTMPNGMCMGGQFDYCGLWLNSEYGLGHTSESCTTYKGYTQMSYQKEFNFSHLEVWGLENPAASEGDDGTKVGSILDNVEQQSFLEMAGRTIHSDGMREPPPE